MPPRQPNLSRMAEGEDEARSPFPVLDALDGTAFSVLLPTASSVRELREAVAARASAHAAEEAAEHPSGANMQQSSCAPGEVLLLCVDESSHEPPILLLDGKWLTQHALPHDEKKVFALRVPAIRASSGPEGGMREAVAALVESCRCDGFRSGPSSEVSFSSSALASSAADAPPDTTKEGRALAELAAGARRLQGAQLKAESLAGDCKAQVDAAHACLSRAEIQDAALDALLSLVDTLPP
eukprot:CAMPEP_0180170376 /NCGR_PEP_ID=MMETSP0986-20121125/33795_1 /TAXON_ID=697907 /ORGANISM="non described non described, Strain CCMP2293" /LENGTH=239 /DNA_ID=CAMNT_0022122065 /DNA_START=68 /DNA_END=783 /DNA_ORIENTATION=+